MTTLLDAARQALEALERCAMTIDWEWGDCRELEEMRQTGQYTDETTPAITALRQAIEQAEQQYVMENAQGELERISLVQTGVGIGKPEQEPVATWENHFDMKEWQVHALRAGWSPTPPQRKPEMLTDEEINSIDWKQGQTLRAFIRAIEAAVLKKNGGGE